MLQEHIRLIEQFYEVYSRCVELGWITPEDFQLIQRIANLHPCNQEQKDMLHRVMRGIERRRITIQPSAVPGQFLQLSDNTT